jgi:hypothetical protein
MEDREDNSGGTKGGTKKKAQLQCSVRAAVQFSLCLTDQLGLNARHSVIGVPVEIRDAATVFGCVGVGIRGKGSQW